MVKRKIRKRPSVDAEFVCEAGIEPVLSDLLSATQPLSIRACKHSSQWSLSKNVSLLPSTKPGLFTCLRGRRLYHLASFPLQGNPGIEPGLLRVRL